MGDSGGFLQLLSRLDSRNSLLRGSIVPLPQARIPSHLPHFGEVCVVYVPRRMKLFTRCGKTVSTSIHATLELLRGRDELDSSGSTNPSQGLSYAVAARLLQGLDSERNRREC